MSNMTTTPRTRPVHPFHGARRARPTLKHRPLVWECMLGAVYASDGETTRYFDYDWDAARAFAGVAEASDLRVARLSQHPSAPCSFPGVGTRTCPAPSARQFVLWGVRS